MSKKTAIRNYANQQIDAMIEFINSSDLFATTDFAIPQRRFNFALRVHTSLGGTKFGKPMVSFAAGTFAYYCNHPRLEDRYLYTEYKHIQHDPEIGTFRGHWQKALIALIAHEVAHAYEHYARMIKRFRDVDLFTVPDTMVCYSPNDYGIEGHGAEWQYIYRVLRTKFAGGDFAPTKLDISYKPKRKVNRALKTHTETHTERYQGRFDTLRKTIYYRPETGEKVAGVYTRTSGGYTPVYEVHCSDTYIVWPGDAPHQRVLDGKEARKIIFATCK